MSDTKNLYYARLFCKIQEVKGWKRCVNGLLEGQDLFARVVKYIIENMGTGWSKPDHAFSGFSAIRSLVTNG